MKNAQKLLWLFLFERVWGGWEGLQNSLRKLWGDAYIHHFVGGNCCMGVCTVQTHQIAHLKMYSLFIAVYLSKEKRQYRDKILSHGKRYLIQFSSSLIVKSKEWNLKFEYKVYKIIWTE